MNRARLKNKRKTRVVLALSAFSEKGEKEAGSVFFFPFLKGNLSIYLFSWRSFVSGRLFIKFFLKQSSKIGAGCFFVLTANLRIFLFGISLL
jgi:hypothetical protein